MGNTSMTGSSTSPATEHCATKSQRLELCVCVFFPSILDIKFVGRTSRGHTGGRSHRIFNPPSFCGVGGKKTLDYFA